MDATLGGEWLSPPPPHEARAPASTTTRRLASLFTLEWQFCKDIDIALFLPDAS